VKKMCAWPSVASITAGRDKKTMTAAAMISRSASSKKPNACAPRERGGAGGVTLVIGISPNSGDSL
jgi:hypothetical protein